MDRPRRAAHRDQHIPLPDDIGIPQGNGLHRIPRGLRQYADTDADHGHIRHAVLLLHLPGHVAPVAEGHPDRIRLLHRRFRGQDQKFLLRAGHDRPGIGAGGEQGVVKPVHVLLDRMDRHDPLIRRLDAGPQAVEHGTEVLGCIVVILHHRLDLIFDRLFTFRRLSRSRSRRLHRRRRRFRDLVLGDRDRLPYCLLLEKTVCQRQHRRK